MNKFRKFIIALSLVLTFGGFAEPVFNGIGITSVPQIYAADNTDVNTAGENIRTSVIQLIRIGYDRLRYPVSLMMMVFAIGIAVVYRKQGVPMIIGISGFTFLWAFAPVIVKLLQGLAGGGGPISIE